jgi:hypothetical protein
MLKSFACRWIAFFPRLRVPRPAELTIAASEAIRILRLSFEHSSTEVSMKDVILNLPTFGFIVSTRAALGVGIGLLVSERLSAQRRRAIGAMLIAVGAATTVPAAMSVIRGLRRSKQRKMSSPIERDKHLIGATRFPRKGDDLP